MHTESPDAIPPLPQDRSEEPEVVSDEALAVAISRKMKEAEAAGDRMAFVCWLNALARLPELPAPVDRSAEGEAETDIESAWAVVSDWGTIDSFCWESTCQHWLEDDETPAMRCEATARARAKLCGVSFRAVRFVPSREGTVGDWPTGDGSGKRAGLEGSIPSSPTAHAPVSRPEPRTGGPWLTAGARLDSRGDGIEEQRGVVWWGEAHAQRAEAAALRAERDLWRDRHGAAEVKEEQALRDLSAETLRREQSDEAWRVTSAALTAAESRAASLKEIAEEAVDALGMSRWKTAIDLRARLSALAEQTGGQDGK